MSQGLRVAVLACALLSGAAIAIKAYFIPATDRYLELSIREQMIREALAFERLIHIVAVAANGDRATVRRALFAISSDPNIPIELRRGPVIVRQYGSRPGKAARSEVERQALKTGRAVFRHTRQHFEYVYPLRSSGVCGRCHVDASGRAIPSGTVLGLAVKRQPRRVLRESSLTYFVMGLFWENLLMVMVLMAVLFAVAFAWWLRPLRVLAERAERAVLAADDEAPTSADELESIERAIGLAEERSPEDPYDD